MAKKKTTQTSRSIQNRRARHDYELDDSLVVGLELTGKETKALRLGQGSLRGAYVAVKSDELWLIGALVGQVPGISLDDDEQRRTRKLLAKRREIDRLIAEKQQGRSIVPLEIMTRGRYIKLRISTGKGKKLYDKRQTLKKRQQDREANAAMKNLR